MLYVVTEDELDEAKSRLTLHSFPVKERLVVASAHLPDRQLVGSAHTRAAMLPRVLLLAGLLDATGHLRPVGFLRGIPSHDYQYSLSHRDLYGISVPGPGGSVTRVSKRSLSCLDPNEI
jgi:hypothetical protein